MQAVSKKGLFASAVCLFLAACHGSNSTPSSVPPTVGSFSCTPTTLPSTFTTGIAVSCSDTTAKTSDGSAPNFSWVFGDQIPSGSTQPTTGNLTTPVVHVYAQPGVYQVVLTVSDDHGTTASQAQYVQVSASTGTAITAEGVENWAWTSGSKYINSAGDFQTLLQASTSNQPSARQNSATWTTAAIVGHPVGQLLVFGGFGYDSTATAGYLNDLWAFDPSNNEWTWLSGSNRANSIGAWPKDKNGNLIPNTTSPANVISGRTAVAQWKDKNGNLWLFGGSGYDINNNIGYLSDLWELNPNTGEATYISGPAVMNTAATPGTQGTANPGNFPAGRSFAITWVDQNGGFWMFGGQGLNGSNVETFNDLWYYNPNNSQGWTWISGGTVATNSPGVYGTLQTAAAGNSPGARVSAQSWVDSQGNLWMFGGDGYDSAGSFGALSDLWEYNIAKNQWTWISGSNVQGTGSVYGTRGHSTPAAGTTNMPGGRVGTVGWVDANHNFWLFGGSGSDSTSTTSANDGGGALNELWTFNTTTQKWTWMGGVNVVNTPGVYLTQYPSTTGSSYNSPGSRVWGSSWVDNSGNFWMFGGAGVDSTGSSGYLNDLWTIQLTVQPVP